MDMDSLKHANFGVDIFAGDLLTTHTFLNTQAANLHNDQHIFQKLNY